MGRPEITMKFLSFLMISAVFAASFDREDSMEDSMEELAEGMNPFGSLDEDEFLEQFHKPQIDDPEEKEKRAEALKKHEQEVLENNEAFLAGNQTWWDEINEYSDLPEDDFEANHTGLVGNMEKRFAKGMYNVPLPYDAESERFYDAVRYSRSSVPASYNSVTLGNVSPVKSQGSCGSCVAFATMALVETCFKKAVGTFGDYSEQHFVDCAFDGDLVNGCNGAAPHGYAKWLKEKKPKLAHETTYPYKATKQSCSTTYKQFYQGVDISGAYWTESGDEETLKKLVATHGAVVTGVAAAGPFSQYKGGIFAGCSSNAQQDHAVAVVGYGTEGGVDYWLVKNSWGTSWGEKGYIRVKRGVKMCGIGQSIVTVSCAKGSSSATTSAPVTTTTTKAPATDSPDCQDTYTNCPDLAKSHCWDEYIKAECKKSCGLCKGMTPVSSNTCYDEFDNCAELCAWVPGMCKKSCNKC